MAVSRFHSTMLSSLKVPRQNVPSIARVAAGAFGFLTLIQVFEGPERYGASSLFETISSRPSLHTDSNKGVTELHFINDAAGPKGTVILNVRESLDDINMKMPLRS
jgi:hypothetical protein